MKPSVVFLSAVLFGLLSGASRTDGAVTEDEAAGLALAAVERLVGTAHEVVPRRSSRRGPSFVVDGRWWVYTVAVTGHIANLRDHDFRESRHMQHVLDKRPSSAEVQAAALELVHRVFPDFDMKEFVLDAAKPKGEPARVEARWRRVIPGSGFPGPGHCFVDFCWLDRAVHSMGAECPPIPDEWRRPAAVTAEEAEKIGKAALGDLKGGWVETTKDLCVWDEPNPPRPAWNVLLRSGPRDKPEECMSVRSVFVDPWTGEIIHTTTWKSAGAGPAEPQAKPSGTATMPTAQPPTDAEAERSAHGRWLLAAGAGLLVLALAAAMVCARRRRASAARKRGGLVGGPDQPWACR